MDNNVDLETFKREEGVDVCARIAKHLEGRVVIAVTGPEGCGKSLVSDSTLHYLDDDRDIKDIPNKGKSVMEEDPGDALGRAHSEIVDHKGRPIRVTIVRDVYDLEKMNDFEGTDIIFFLHSWTKLPKDVNPSLTIDMEHILTNRELFNPEIRGDRVHRKWGITVHDQLLAEKLSQTLSVLKKESDHRVKRDRPTIRNAFLNVAQKAILPLVNALKP